MTSRLGKGFWLAFMVLSTSSSAVATEFEQLPTEVQATLLQTPLASEHAPVAEFVWSYRLRRTGKDDRVIKEWFKGGARGFSVVEVWQADFDQTSTTEHSDEWGWLVSTHVTDAPSPVDHRSRLSARGLFRLDSTPNMMSVDFGDMKLPLQSADQFTLRLSKDETSVNQHCVVGEPQESKQFFPADWS